MPSAAEFTGSGRTSSGSISAEKSKTDGAALPTSMRLEPLSVTPSLVTVAVTIALNGRKELNNAVTNPVGDTMTLNGLLVAKLEAVRPVIGLSRASRPTTVSCVVEPATTTDSGADSTIDTTLRRTVTVIIPSAIPLAAMMLAVPSSTAVTVALAPSPSTTATDGALVRHNTDGAAITDWLASLTRAVTNRVSPAAVMGSVDATESVTVAA